MSEEKKNEILDEKIDAEEMKAVNGGSMKSALDGVIRETLEGTKKQGGCTKSYYREHCSATVEAGSWCGSNDKCMLFSERYHERIVRSSRKR